MTATVSGAGAMPGWSGRRVARPMAIGAAVAVVVTLPFSWSRLHDLGSSRGMARQRSALATFHHDLEPIVSDGATVVALGLMPGIGDIRDGRYPAAVLSGMADDWVRQLRSLDARARRLETPAFLAPTQRLYVRAFDGYVAVATTLRQAAAAPDADRQQLLNRAAALGRGSDRTYDQAEKALEHEDARLGRKEHR